MPELFVYDASDVNRGNNYCRYADEPPVIGLRQALKELSPPAPFLIRGLFGDGGWEDGKIIVRNTFGRELLQTLLQKVLQNGHDKDKPSGKNLNHPYEEYFVETLGIKFCDMVWADECLDSDNAMPYRFYDDIGCHPQGFVNDFTIILDSSLYTPTDKKRSLFYQPSIELRRKALLGIIIDDTNPDRPKLQPMRFSLTPENLEQVVAEIQRAGYFAEQGLSQTS